MSIKIVVDMNMLNSLASGCLFLALACSTLYAAEPPEFVAEAGFFQLPEGWKLGACSAVAVSKKGEIYLFHRGQHPLICFDAQGRYLRHWGDTVIQVAHGLRVDAEDNVWATDIGAHRVFKFDPTGKMLLTLGTGKPGKGDDQFDRPTDVAFGPGGDFFVSDGYGNTRVLRFSAAGKLEKIWGTPGKAAGEFNLPHSALSDREGRLLIGDRENDRIQVFDREGKLQAVWPGFAPYGLALNPDGLLFVADGRANQVLCLDAAGKVLKRYGSKGKEPGQFELPHMLAFDAAGNMYVAEVNGQRVQRFVKK